MRNSALPISLLPLRWYPNSSLAPSSAGRWQRLLLSARYILLALLLYACQQAPPSVYLEDRQKIDSLTNRYKDPGSLVYLQRQFEHEGNILGSIIALKKYGWALRNDCRFGEALRVHSESLRQAELITDTLEWIQALNDIGTDYRRMGILDVAQEYHYKARMLCEEHSDTTYQAKKNYGITLNCLGNIYITFGNYEQAEQVLRLALEEEQQLHSALGQAINYANLGTIFRHQNEIDSAWVYYRRSMELNEQAGSALGISLCHSYFGALYQQAKEYTKAEEEYQAAYEIMKAIKDDWHALAPLISLAEIYNTIQDDQRVEEYLKRAKEMAERIHSKEHLAEIHNLYYQYYNRLGNYQQALRDKEMADALQDSVISIEKINRIQNASINIERNRQRQLIDAVQLKLQEERTKREVSFGIFALTLLILIALVGVLLYIQKLRSRNHRTLEKLSTLRENFFTNITHEFRTPLTLILGISHDLQRDPQLSPEIKEKTQIIERQGKNLLALINQLLDIARIKSSIGNSDRYSGDIAGRLAMIVETYRDYAESRHIELHYASSGPILMTFAPDYVDKVMNNLLSNALKFTPEGGHISVHTYRDGDRLCLEVADSGVGINPEALEHIFEPFYQSKSNVRNIGSGVGLALVKQIIDTVGGEIKVKSTLGEGTTFFIQVPIRQTNHPPLSTTSIEAPALDLPKELHDQVGSSDCRILVIEDNPDVASYIGSALSEHYAVHYASNGQEGLNRALDLMPDLIITDLMMPQMDGLELCRRVRADQILDHIPIIVVTAKITEEERIQGFEAGADAYLAKPFNSDELRAIVERQLERHRHLRQKGSLGLSDSKETSPELSEAEQRFLNKTDEIIYSTLGKRKLEVNTLAEKLCMSPRQLHRKLVALTGLPPVAYILNRKMERAKELLSSQPTLTIDEIAERSGFEFGSSFFHAFKKLYGVTPAEYRKGEDSTLPIGEDLSVASEA